MIDHKTFTKGMAILTQRFGDHLPSSEIRLLETGLKELSNEEFAEAVKRTLVTFEPKGYDAHDRFPSAQFIRKQVDTTSNVNEKAALAWLKVLSASEGPMATGVCDTGPHPTGEALTAEEMFCAGGLSGLRRIALAADDPASLRSMEFTFRDAFKGLQHGSVELKALSGPAPKSLPAPVNLPQAMLDRCKEVDAAMYAIKALMRSRKGNLTRPDIEKGLSDYETSVLGSAVAAMRASDANVRSRLPMGWVTRA